MKTILWVPELATLDKTTKLVLINADSNINIMNGIIKHFKNNYHFCIMMPREEDCNVKFRSIISDEVTIYENQSFYGDAFTLRYNFDFHKMKNIIEHVKPDIIVCNNSAITRNFKVVIYQLSNKNIKLINFMHFLDLPKEKKVPQEVSYFLRQMDGILVCDLAVFQSQTVCDKTMNAINIYLNQYISDSSRINENITIWNATYSQEEIDQRKPVVDKKDIKKRILFPNRLSSTNYSNHLRFFEAIQYISKKRNDFEVIVNNPTQSMSWEEIKKLCPNLKMINDGKLLNRDEYLNLLFTCDIGVALFTDEGHGGVSSKEFQAAGCLPVFPKVNEYAHLMPQDYKGFCKQNLCDLEEALIYILDICRTPEGNSLIDIAKKSIYERDSFEYNIPKIKQSLIDLIGE